MSSTLQDTRAQRNAAHAPDMSSMSAIGTKRTSLFAPHMSAIGGKADMTFCTAHVCF